MIVYNSRDIHGAVNFVVSKHLRITNLLTKKLRLEFIQKNIYDYFKAF